MDTEKSLLTTSYLYDNINASRKETNMELIANAIAATGTLLVFLGLAFFTTETASACIASSAIILLGMVILLWICNRWNFDADASGKRKED